MLHLFTAGGLSEIGGRSAHIMDISFKILLLCQSLSFAYDCILATASDLPALMISNGAEAAAPEAAAWAYDAEFNLLESGYSAQSIISRMPLILEGKCVDIIEFLSFVIKTKGRAKVLTQALPKKPYSSSER